MNENDMDMNDNEEVIYDDAGNVIAVRAGGGHLSNLDPDAIRSLVGKQQVPITVKHDLVAGTSDDIDPTRIMVIRDMGLGDIMMTLPVLTRIKEKYPGAEVHFATKNEYMELAEGFCDKVFSYRNVEPNLYDKIVNLVMYCELHKDAATQPRQDILLSGGEVDFSGFAVDEISFRERYIKDKDRDNLWEKLESLGITKGRPKISFCTDSNRASKNWSPKKFDMLAQRLSKEYPDYDILLFGAASKNFTVSDNVFDLTNQMSLREFIVALDESDLIVTLETGGMHVAGMLQKQFVVICGPSNYNLFTKYYKNYSVIYPDINCYPCNGECETNRCIRIIGVDFVHNVVKERLDRGEDSFTTIYPATQDVADIHVRKSVEVQRIGILSVWAEQGLGFLTRDFRKALMNDFEIYVYGTFPMYAPNHAPLEGEWNIPNLFLDDKTREHMDIDFVVDWAEENRLDTMIIMEPTGDKIWDLVLQLRGSGVQTIGVPMIEISKAEEILNHNFFHKTIALTKQCYEVLLQYSVNNVTHIPYGIAAYEAGEHKYLANKEDIVFYFNAGWADERKNSDAVLKAFDKATQERDDIVLFFHSQHDMNHFPPDQIEIVCDNNQVVFSSGSLAYDEVMSITKTADVILIPTKREGLGLLFLEALSYGKPIIAVDHPPMNQYIKNNINGYLCNGVEEDIVINDQPLVTQKNIDIDDLADKILKISDRDLIFTMSANAKNIYAREYTFDNFSDKLSSVFESGTQEMPCILFIANYLYPKIGGAEQTALLYLSYLAKNGYDVYAVCDRGGVDAAIHRAGDFFGQTTAIKYEGIKIIQSAENVEKCAEYYIDRIKPDLVLSQLEIAGEVMKVAKRMDVPTAMYIHSVAEHYCSYHAWDCNGGKKDLRTCAFDAEYCMSEYKKYKDHQFDHADYIIVNSEFTKEITRRFYDRDSFVLYPPVHNIERVNEPNNKRYIMFVNPVVDKGADIVCAVANLLPDHIFLFVGVNDEGIRAQITEKIPNGRVAVTPYSENINNEYSQSKLVIMPSVVQEGFGMIAAEAMHAGIPTITSGRGGLCDVSGSAAVIVEDFTSVEAWALAIKNILEDQDYYNKVRKDGMKHAEQFLLENQGPRFKEFIDSILSK